MANLKNLKKLKRTCDRHMFPQPMKFSHWAGRFRASYRCTFPGCRQTALYARFRRFGPVQRVG